MLKISVQLLHNQLEQLVCLYIKSQGPPQNTIVDRHSTCTLFALFFQSTCTLFTHDQIDFSGITVHPGELVHHLRFINQTGLATSSNSASFLSNCLPFYALVDLVPVHYLRFQEKQLGFIVRVSIHHCKNTRLKWNGFKHDEQLANKQPNSY